MNIEKSTAFKIIAVIFIAAVCIWSGIVPITINAILSELKRPNPPAPIEQQTGAAAIADLNGDTAATLTGYEMTFPEGTLDWRVVYASTCTRCGLESAYTVITPTYWCLFIGYRWLSCQPVISEAVH